MEPFGGSLTDGAVEILKAASAQSKAHLARELAQKVVQ